ncbi:NAD(P)H-dependent oxidoreductase [Natronococcus occultus]|uniref:Putative NADPH-quinone reductase (Modulator of drug activity B) n=1 Tax=Natronococcus occultus SP4 TaxID=694430 RepID=L0JSQ9_9EURY|nr:NAD(P)H-dependent oxidoreductase [Natronococcus occultus]AGB36047.1 putative NADPH-quinone reductase (modulator of drug activity B) [Natronococcus occultus SP4]
MNVLLILGHPRTDSYCAALAEAYRNGASEAGVDVRELAVADLEFDPDVHADCPSDQPLEPDLQAAEREIEWADHLVFVYPNWWGTMPARLKGFFDRVFRPGFAFSFYEEGEGAGKEELLNDKTAELLVTMDVPPRIYRWLLRQPGNHALKRATLGYAGVRTTRVTNLGPIEDSDLEQREAWLEEARELGRRLETGPDSQLGRVTRTATSWLRALRLQFYPMAWIAYTVGALAAAGSDVFATGAYWLGLAFLFVLEAATVLSNEYADYETDRENTFAGPFTGGSRVLVDGELSFEQLRAGIGAFLTAAAVLGGATLFVGAGSTAATAGTMGVLTVLALGYTLPPPKLAYRTLGELDVAITHSVGVLLLGFVVLGGSWHDPLPWLLGVPFLLSVLPAITLAGVPDVDADRSADKRTIAVRFGVDGAAMVAAATAVLAAVLGTLFQLFDIVPGYRPAIYLALVHALGLVWLLRERLEAEAGAQRIDLLLIASLSYIAWFGVVPLVGLL